MEVTNTYKYDYEASFARLDSYLNESGNYEEALLIPDRKDLGYSDGYYLNCYAIFVDIRDSSSLPETHQKKVLAKIYRCYISELTAIMQSSVSCKELYIVGDCVSGIFSDTKKDDVMEVFCAAYTINSLVNTLNLKLEKKGYTKIKIGIGIAKGKTLMIKAGYKYSGLNEVVWMGDVVNKASNLCNIANKGGNKVIVISDEVYDSLSGYYGGKDEKTPYQQWFTKKTFDSYTGDIFRIDMNEWLERQK